MAKPVAAATPPWLAQRRPWAQEQQEPDIPPFPPGISDGSRGVWQESLQEHNAGCWRSDADSPRNDAPDTFDSYRLSVLSWNPGRIARLGMDVLSGVLQEYPATAGAGGFWRGLGVILGCFCGHFGVS